jgi:citrate lyase subunit beta / citryl-CoA lyase
MARRVRRSGLTMPINTPRFVDRSWTRNCDYLNFDFEDSVPQSQKAYARTLVAHAVAQGLKGGADITIRINCAYPEADVPAAVLPGVIQINFPKAETAEQMRNLDRLITEAERVQGIRPGTVHIGANIETTLGVTNSYEIASASPRIDTFSGGTGYDMSMDMGVEMFVGFDQFVYNRGEGALVAKALGLEYTGSVYVPDTSGNVGDRELTRRRAEANRKAGLRAGGGLHPNTVQPQNIGLTPTPEEVQEAQRILAYFAQLDEQAEVEGELNGRIVDKYEAARAAELLEWSALCAQKDAHKAREQTRTTALEAHARPQA